MFHFGTSMEPLIFDELALSGWLLHRDGKPINGIRAIVRRKFARKHRSDAAKNDAGTVFGGAAGQDSCGALLNAPAFVNLPNGEKPASLAPLDR